MFCYSIGNKKIGSDTLIFNMTTATACPSKARGLCRHPEKCYAMKAEKMYPQCLPYRKRQAAYWSKNSAFRIAQDLVSAFGKHKKLRYVRVSECGDFRNQKDVEKLCEIARRCSFATFYTYTARKDLSFDARPANLIIQGSGFLIDNEFTAVKEYAPGAMRCAGDCRKCGLCKEAKGRIINVLYH